MKKTISCLIAAMVFGMIVMFILLTWAHYRGCSVDLKVAVPPGFQLNCAGAPHQVALNFGRQPSRMALSKALTIVAERTQALGPARVYVAAEVLKHPVAASQVDPPAGAQPSLLVVQQLLAQAEASSSIGVCLVPEGGYRVQRLR